MRRQISTHSPRVGRTSEILKGIEEDEQFQLTRPVWGEPHWIQTKTRRCNISTHSPRAGRTGQVVAGMPIEAHFNSLAPCGANRISQPIPFSVTLISTHSPRAGRTHTLYKHVVRSKHFNSLAPCGANQLAVLIFFCISLFQLTRPVRGEPKQAAALCLYAHISTHSPRAGRTAQIIRQNDIYADFNSLAPCGANLLYGSLHQTAQTFQLTRPVRGEPRDYT